MVEPGTQRQQDGAGDVGGDATGVELGPHGATGEMFHDEQAHAVVFHEIVDGHDMRVIERRQQASFGEEAFGDRGISAQFGRQLFDGDRSTELTMTPGDDDSGSAAPELAADLVRGQCIPEPLDVEH